MPRAAPHPSPAFRRVSPCVPPRPSLRSAAAVPAFRRGRPRVPP